MRHRISHGRTLRVCAFVLLVLFVVAVTLNAAILDGSTPRKPVHLDAVANKTVLRTLLAHHALIPIMRHSALPGSDPRQLIEYIPNRDGMMGYPSTKVLIVRLPESDLPVVSVVVANHDLFDPDTGLLSQDKKTMRLKGKYFDNFWERLAYLSVFRSSKVVFAASAGLRPHGRVQKVGAKRDFFSEKCPSSGRDFRLYFRPIYGPRSMPGQVLFDSKSTPSRTLVIRGKQAIRNAIAYSIAQNIGATVPESKLVRFYLNGKDLCLATLTSHLSRRQLMQQAGMHGAKVYKYKTRSNDPESVKAHNQLKEWSNQRLSAHEIAEVVDINNLTRSLLAFMVLGNRDWAQGVAVKQADNDQWRWISWDMDTTFREAERSMDPLTLILRRGDVRAKLFKNLLRDPLYVEWFLDLTTDQLNHRLDRRSVDDLLEPYREPIRRYDNRRDRLKNIGPWLYDRPRFLLSELQNHLAPDRSLLTVEIRGSRSEALHLEIDGYIHTSPYRGQYFSGQRIEVSMAAKNTALLKHWIVNDKLVSNKKLHIPLYSDLSIVAVAAD